MNAMKLPLKDTTPLASITLVCALLIGTMPSTAEANVCRKAKARPPCVESIDVRPNSITGISIVDNSLTTADILDNSLTGADLQDNSLTATDQSDEAGADFASGSQFFSLTGGNDIVRSVTITAPTAGRVIVSASGYFSFSAPAAADLAGCTITTGTATDLTNLIAAGDSTDTAMNYIPFGATRGFTVAAGSTTFNLVCDEFSGIVAVNDTNLTAIFVPTAY